METKYKVKTRLGNTAYLVMNNFGNPHPKYTWSHNEEIIASDKHVDLGIASVLNISNVREEDFGTYTLLMENIYGQYRSKYELLPPGMLLHLLLIYFESGGYKHIYLNQFLIGHFSN